MRYIFTLILAAMVGLSSQAQTTAPKKAAKKAKTSTTKVQKEVPPPAPVIEGAQIKFDEETHDMGTIKEGEDATWNIKVSNIGNKPLVITSANPGCGCTVSDYTKEPIPPGGTGYIKATYRSAGRGTGTFSKSLTVTSNSVNDNNKVLTFTVNVTANGN